MKILKNRKYVTDLISKFLKDKAAKAALSFLTKKIAFLATGPGGWIFGIAFGILWNKFGDKAIKWLSRKGAFAVDLGTGKVKANKITKARKEGTNEDYDNAVDDMFK